MLILRGGHDFFLLVFRGGGAIENFFVCGGRYKGGPSKNQ